MSYTYYTMSREKLHGDQTKNMARNLPLNFIKNDTVPEFLNSGTRITHLDCEPRRVLWRIGGHMACFLPAAGRVKSSTGFIHNTTTDRQHQSVSRIMEKPMFFAQHKSFTINKHFHG